MSAALFAVACGGGTQPTVAPPTRAAVATPAPATDAPATEVPTTDAPATDAPSDEPTVEPTTGTGDELDPSLSDAGVVGRGTITGDSRLDVSRDGTYDIVGVADHGFGSGCEASFDGEEFIAVAYDDDAPDGQLRQMGVTVAASDVPETDETVSAIEDGGVYMEFASENFFGTAYSADQADDDRTSATINVTRSGDRLTFDFSGNTWDEVDMTGLVVCEIAG